MPSLEIPFKNWGAEGTVNGMLLVSSRIDSTVGEATMELQGRLGEQIPIIPIITREKRLDELAMAQFVFGSWPAIITGGRSVEGRIHRGPSHYLIMIQERVIDDPTFVAGLADDFSLYRHLNELDEMHLTLGSVTVSGQILTIQSDLQTCKIA